MFEPFENKNVTMWFRTEELDLSATPEACYYWEDSKCEKVEEVLPTDAPELLRKITVTISYHDASIFHIIITGISVSRVLHFANKTYVVWYSKK